MNYPIGIVIAAALIAGAVFLSNQNDLDAAGSGTWGAIGAHGSEGRSRGWVVNTQTGKMRMCFYANNNQIHCYYQR